MTDARPNAWARFCRAVSLIPWSIRLPYSYETAVDDVLRCDFAAARKRLSKLLASMPDEFVDVLTVKLLLARALLQTGEPAAAAALFPAALRPLQTPKRSNNAMERSYLKYVGNQIYEHATQQLGQPSSFEIGVDFEDLDVDKVRERLQQTFPILEFHSSDEDSRPH